MSKKKFRTDPKNIRNHSDRNKQAIRQSLDLVGAGRSVLADAEGIVRAGNGVFEAWGDKPIKVVETDGKELVVVQRTDLRGPEAVQAAILDNVAGDTSAYDYNAALLRESVQADKTLLGLLRQDPRLLQVLVNPEQIVIDPKGEWTGMPDFNNPGKTYYRTLIVHFLDQKSVEDFARRIGQTFSPGAKYIFHPKQEREPMGEVKLKA